jgi:hypothetical protein
MGEAVLEVYSTEVMDLEVSDKSAVSLSVFLDICILFSLVLCWCSITGLVRTVRPMTSLLALSQDRRMEPGCRCEYKRQLW